MLMSLQITCENQEVKEREPPPPTLLNMAITKKKGKCKE